MFINVPPGLSLNLGSDYVKRTFADLFLNAGTNSLAVMKFLSAEFGGLDRIAT